MDMYSRTEPTQPDLPGGQPQPGDVRLGPALTAILWLLALAILATASFAGWQLWLVWQTAYEPYWQHLHVALFVLFVLALLYIPVSLLGPLFRQVPLLVRQVRGQSERARQAAIAGDDALAPLAADQPEPLPSAEMLIHPVQFGPFTPPRQQRRGRRSLVVGRIVIVLLSGGMIALLLVIQPLFSDSLGMPLVFMFVITNVMFGLVGITNLITLAVGLWQRVRRGARKLPGAIEADDWGIRQRRAGRRTDQAPSFAWHEIRAFYKADDLLRLQGRVVTEGTAQKTTYTVDTGDRMLQWTLWENSTEARRADSERLCRLVVARTRLPLRDLSAVATAQGLALLDIALSTVRLPLGIRFMYQPSRTPVAPSQPVPSDGRPLGRTRHWRLLTVSSVAFISLALVLVFTGMVAQMIQSYQYDDLIHQHIDREDPYYTIDFRTNDGAWPSYPATATSGGYVFAADGYHLTGVQAGGPTEAVLGTTYGDATVELTAGLAGDTPGEYGVVLRESDDGADKVVFSLSSAGGWMLARYHVDATGAQQRTVLLANAHSDAVQTGRDANNWLTVIMRGGEYLCFVRDQPVGIYHDDAGLTPRQGHAGVWLGAGHAEGVYYYFSVYPPA